MASGFRAKSIKTRIETIDFLNTVETDICGFRAKSIKTRIETNCFCFFWGCNFGVLEQNPSKQGLKP